MSYPYKPRSADPLDPVYILSCSQCELKAEHSHAKDRLIPYTEVGESKSRGAKTRGMAVDHLYKCEICGNVRRWGLSDSRKLDPIELLDLERVDA